MRTVTDLATKALDSSAPPAPLASAKTATTVHSSHARRPLQFATLMLQLAGLLLVFRLYELEEPIFLVLATTVFAGFAVHYWLPTRFKDLWWITLSLGGAYLILSPLAATLLIAVGLTFYGIVAAPLTYAVRVGLVIAVAALLVYGRVTLGYGFPYELWPVLGAVFMFRMMIYLYDLRHARGTPSLKDYLQYFFLLPNYYFLLFPVIDFQTFRRTRHQRDIHDVAQQGIYWMARGTIQLLLYRLVYQFKLPFAPEAITSFGSLATTMVLTYLLYLRVSGQFHIIIGMLHLFGFDLPETNRRYLLANSLTDFWRRINIYWKEFMVKLVYFPVYFRLRRRNDTTAKIVATAAVFITTWFLHACQWLWLRGEFLVSATDILFWAILGTLVTINLLVEKPNRSSTTARSRALNALQTLGTFTLIVVLWSLWSSSSVSEWIEVVTYWEVG